MGTNIKYKSGFYGDGILSRFPIEYSANYIIIISDKIKKTIKKFKIPFEMQVTIQS